LLKDRIVFLGSAIDDNLANSVIAQLLLLAAEDPEKEINMYINSPGGSTSAGFAIFDTMQFIKPPVHTICTGLAASFAAILLLSGAKGKRFALPNSEIMIHQPHGGAQGQASDIAISAQRILRIREQLNQITSDRTGQAIEKVAKDMDRDYFMSAEEAKTYGIIDQVLTSL
jgi:ATP-dependent Clp protease protease subunit